MKKQALLLFTFVLLAGMAHAQWLPQNPNLGGLNMSSICAVDSNVVWMTARDTVQANSGNRIARTTNGGTTWTNFSIPGYAAYIPSNITAVSADTAWVAMYNNAAGGGVILRTNNGGTSWTQQTTATFTAPDGFPNFVHFFDRNNGVCVGDPNGGYFEIYTTANGGTNWTRVPQGNIPASMVGEYGVIDKYTAKGNTIYFLTSNGRVFSSTNKGLNWSAPAFVNNTNDTMYAFWVASKSATEAIAAVHLPNDPNFKIASTTNSGASWQISEATGNISGYGKAEYVSLTPTSGFYVSFDNNFVFTSYDGKVWSTPTLLPYLSCFSDGGLAASNGYAWVSGRYRSSFSTGLYRFSKPNTDILPLQVQVGNGKTGCFGHDSLQVKLLNSGRNTINFATTNAQVVFSIQTRPVGNAGFNAPFQMPLSITTGQLAAGQTMVQTLPGGVLLMESNDFLINAVVTLNDGNTATHFNDTSGTYYFNGPNLMTVTDSITAQPASLLYKGSAGILHCSGPFASIQWQSRLPNGIWTNELFAGAQANDYVIHPQETRYYRALLCGTKTTDSVMVNVPAYGNIVGNTYYDLQTNASINNRVQLKQGGGIAAVFTGSVDPGDNSSPSRGSFYNYNAGTKWGPIPTSRLESVRTGFPSLVITKNNKEVIISHNSATQKLNVLSRAVAGTGSWSEQLNVMKGMWPHAICSGGDTIHVIALDTTLIAGARLRYYRSTNAGTSWDISTYLPGYDVTNGFAATFFPETYTIEAYQQTVAIVAGGYNNKLQLWKSTNGGQVWTTKVIKSFPAGFDGNTTLPVTESTDGATSIAIDNSGTVHVFAGGMAISDNTAGDGTFNYFPQVDALLYWNDKKGTDSLTVVATADEANAPTGGYFGTQLNINTTGRASFASASVNRTKNHLYVTFTAPVSFSENPADNLTRRDVFGIMTPDAGNTWSAPKNITNSATSGIDNIFASTANNNSSAIHLLWETSTDASVTLNNSSVRKTILHDIVPYTKFASISQLSLTQNTFCGGDSLIASFRVIGDLGQVMLQLSNTNGEFIFPTLLGTRTSTTVNDVFRVKIPNHLPNSSNYRVRIVDASGQVMSEEMNITYNAAPNKPVISNLRPLTFCNGDSTVLTVDTAQIGVNNHSWFFGAAEQLQLHNATKVTVKTTENILLFVNNNGCTAFSDTVKTVKNALPALLFTTTPDTLACKGSNLTLQVTITSGSATSYQWKKNGVNTGTNSPTLALGTVSNTVTGKYTISMTNACALKTDTIDVTMDDVPTVVQALAANACAGNPAKLIAKGASVGILGYAWKKAGIPVGTTDTLKFPALSPADTGMYTCTMTNGCGSVTTNNLPLNIIAATQVTSTLRDTAICEGAAFSLAVNAAGAALSYQWKKGAVSVGTNNAQFSIANTSMADSGLYSVTVTGTCGISTSNMAKLSVLSSPTISIVKSNDTLYATGSGSTRYQWFRNGTPVPNDTTDHLVLNQSGDYTVSGSNSIGCNRLSAVFSYVKTGIAEESLANGIGLYPNPNNGTVNIRTAGKAAEVNVYDLYGKLLHSEKIAAGQASARLDLSFLAAGAYLVDVAAADGQLKRVKMIISK